MSRFYIRQYVKGRRLGMTLMEVLIVILLISVVSMAIYHSLTQGIVVWKRTNQLVVEQDIAIFFDKFTRDLRNLKLYSLMPFDGSEQTISFPTLILALPDQKREWPSETYQYQLGRVEYYYDPGAGTINAREATYGQSVRKFFSKEQVLVHSVESLRFRYYYVTDEGEVFSKTVQQIYPSAVQVEVTFTDHFGRHTLTRMVDIPIGL